jgi:hypothetical protein
MSVCVYSVFVFSCVSSGLATGWSLVQGVLPIVYKCKITEPHKEEAKAGYGLERHIIIIIIFFSSVLTGILCFHVHATAFQVVSSLLRAVNIWFKLNLSFSSYYQYTRADSLFTSCISRRNDRSRGPRSFICAKSWVVWMPRSQIPVPLKVRMFMFFHQRQLSIYHHNI